MGVNSNNDMDGTPMDIDVVPPEGIKGGGEEGEEEEGAMIDLEENSKEAWSTVTPAKRSVEGNHTISERSGATSSASSMDSSGRTEQSGSKASPMLLDAETHAGSVNVNTPIASSTSTTPATVATTASSASESRATPARSQAPGQSILLPEQVFGMFPTIRHFTAGVRFQTTCSKCGHNQSERVEGYTEIPIDLLSSDSKSGGASTTPAKLQAHDLFKHFFRDDRRSFRCDKCGDEEDDNAIYRSSLVKMPQVLVLHLKRFHYDFKNNRLDKNRAALSFPAKLELRERRDTTSSSSSDGVVHICAADAKSSDTSIDLQEGPKHAIEAAAVQASLASSHTQVANLAPGGLLDGASSEFTYALSGVVRHLGVDCRSGHYVTDVPDGSTATYKTGAPEKWKRCDDMGVTSTTLSRVLAEKESPYLLFYQLLPA